MTEPARVNLSEAARLIEIVLQRIGVDEPEDEQELRSMVARLREVATRRRGEVRYRPLGGIA